MGRYETDPSRTKHCKKINIILARPLRAPNRADELHAGEDGYFGFPNFPRNRLPNLTQYNSEEQVYEPKRKRQQNQERNFMNHKKIKHYFAMKTRLGERAHYWALLTQLLQR